MKLSYKKRSPRYAAVACVVAGVFTLALAMTGCAFQNTEKHTGPVTLQFHEGRTWQLVRPNGELFLADFRAVKESRQYPVPTLASGQKLLDVVYEDLSDHKQRFVKAVLDGGYKPAVAAPGAWQLYSESIECAGFPEECSRAYNYIAAKSQTGGK